MVHARFLGLGGMKLVPSSRVMCHRRVRWKAGRCFVDDVNCVPSLIACISL